ncbi:hypothetical protein [Agrobacterium tumefaciens]|uniref:GAP1-N1 domain-containing protein n=1 Tax=Agrobacterium tumefaciens TaxID=358 RepID=UPI001F1CCD31|nr:hypothetical protein [Agrobacterium tumefaciens]WCK74995.1 hypothetical protein G6L96_027465 [Agrobacterium tumefaciens]
MAEPTIRQQRHGYRNGHQLLESNVRLDRTDQDTIDRLSDLSGQIRPGEVVPPYLTIYPLPSRSFHVVARTWPDLNAPRAGCVMTKSLLVPHEQWAENAQLCDLLANLSAPDVQELHVHEEVIQDAVPPVTDPRTAELVEALFLEARKPIVIFEAKNADVLAIRLVTAFWPAFRSEFSLCTYALSPRKIAGRDFDIVFAPKNSRSKFSDWSGRKIEAGSPKSARHRWSQAIADAIFRSPSPTLASGDALGLLGTGGPGDEAAFRKSLLWNELAEKAPTSASAVLGMLDIINSQPNLAPNAISSSLPIINAAVNSAVETMSSADAWNFLQTLIGKTRGRNGLDPITTEATGDAERLAALDPDVAIDFSRRFDDSNITFPVDLMRGVADGLGAAEAIPINYERIPPRVGAFFVASSETFGQVLARRIRNGELDPSVIMPYFQAGESDWWDGASRRLISEMDSREFAPFLPSVLSRRSGDDLVDQINEIVRRSDLQFPEFDQGLVDAIRDDDTMRVVQEFVVRNVHEARADRFLSKTIRLVPSDLEWLSDGPIEGSRSAALLAGVLAKQGDRFLIEAQRDPSMRRTMLNILAGDIENCAVEIARILTLGAASLDDLLGFGQTVVTALHSGRLRSDLISAVLERGLSLAEPTDERVDEMVLRYFEEVGARQLVRWSVSDGTPTARLAANLSILSGLPRDKLEKVVSCADDLTYRLSRRGPSGVSEDVCRFWGRLILDTRELSPSHYLAAATTSLSATIGLTKSPVAEVVAAAFPAVYLSLVSKDDHNDFGIMDLVFALPRLLYDWDRAKPARHGLVDAFLNSNWPPAYLLLAAARAGIVDRICLRVMRQRGGKKYLNRAISDLERLGSEEIAIIHKDLAEFDDVKMKNEWD